MLKREIILDTETTGLDPKTGHRVIEIACVELINFIPTGNHFHTYLNPERDVPHDAYRIHGITTEFLQDKPLFADVVQDFLDFIGDDTLVIHNAPFDLKFLNAELKQQRRKAFVLDLVIDTLGIARQKFPGAANNLDALCKRFSIDFSERTFHGALLDCHLLAKVYLELVGGSQPSFNLDNQKISSNPEIQQSSIERKHRPARQFNLAAEETEAHQAMVQKIKNPIWNRI